MNEDTGAGVLLGSSGVGAGVTKLPPRFAFSGAPVHVASGFELAVSTCRRRVGTSSVLVFSFDSTTIS